MPPHFRVGRGLGADAIVVDLPDEYHFLATTDWILGRLNPTRNAKLVNVLVRCLADYFSRSVSLNLKIAVLKFFQPVDRIN